MRRVTKAGSWYPKDPKDIMTLYNDVELNDNQEQRAKIIIAPHAGYKYSGHVASIAIKSTAESSKIVLLLHPSHYERMKNLRQCPFDRVDTLLDQSK